MGIDNIIRDLSDSDIDRIECHDHTVKLVPKTNEHCYLLSVLEVEAIARRMGLIPETVKKPLPSECKTAVELVEHYKGIKLIWTGWDHDGIDRKWIVPLEAWGENTFSAMSQYQRIGTWNLKQKEFTWELYEEPEQEAEEPSKPALPDITNEQHFAIWHSALVAAFREALRKGGGE